ncbi:cupin-like domain-containing protein [Alteromonas sp. a30]|uniref:cupin-like domain-containing protein n=1 Tax=Alteromonas sp. a30 TaxID=2730917 RepID=UPI00227F3D92|nr:cupin-like domain-containing protein [Alteromonas sp. a30]MCY7294044.1 cupin-like domain-containing protein [Alteromonas sp. a30]
MTIDWLLNAPNVQEVDASDFNDVFLQLNEQTQPLVIRGLVSHWPVVKLAQSGDVALLDYLAGFGTDEPVTVYRAGPEAQGRIFYDDGFQGGNFQAAFKGLFDVLSLVLQESKAKTGTTYYLGSTLLDQFLPGFRAQNDLPTQLENFEPLVSLWLGNKSRIAAHYDFPQNLACCISGKRRFTLFAPELVDALYPGPIEITPAGQPISLVDFYHPDLTRYPKFEQAMQQAIVAELAPGDALFLPSMWWHHVESLSGINTLINYWWRNTPAYMGSPSDVLTHALLGLKSLPSSQKQAWKALFNYYLFDDADKPEAEKTAAYQPEPMQTGLTWQKEGLSAEQARKLQLRLHNRLRIK